MASVPPGQPAGQHLSPDGRWRWDGTQWVPAQPPVQTRYAPASAPTQAARGTLAYQFSASALWSIAFGLASVLVPIFTPIYFPVLPIFGLWRGVLAVRAGRVAGGAIGIVLNAIGCVVSLLSSGLLH